MRTKVRKEPIFVVGVPRSGTTLMAAMLNSHSRLRCGNETHFFHRLTNSFESYLCEPRSWPARAIGYIYSLRHISYSLSDLYNISHGEFENRLKKARPKVAAILSCFMETYLSQIGKVRWVEKTPHHLLQCRLIRKYFPKSAIVCLVRDPRDVALSLLAVPWGTTKFIDGIIICYKYYRHYINYLLTDPRTITVRYEDLVSKPIDELHRICLHLGEEFEERMLDTSLSAGDVGAMFESYKHNASKPISTGGVFSWKTKLNVDDLASCDTILENMILHFNYEFGSSRGNGNHILYNHIDKIDHLFGVVVDDR